MDSSLDERSVPETRRLADEADSSGLFSYVILLEPNQNQRHTGIAYFNPDDGKYWFLHLASHKTLMNDSLTEYRSGVLILPTVDEERQFQISAICRNLWSEKSEIPYGFSPPSDVFEEETFKYLYGPTKLGLTCATFVLSIFEVAGIKIIDHSNWPDPDDEDTRWQGHIIEVLEEHFPADSDHFEAIRRGGKGLRIRPEFVAAASGMLPHPVTHEKVVPNGQHLLNILRPTQ